jgi:hypothetical protein
MMTLFHSTRFGLRERRQQMCRFALGVVFLLVPALFWGAGTRLTRAATAAALPDHIQELLDNAEVLFQEQRYAESYKLYRSVLTSEPGNRQAIERVFDIARYYKDQQQEAEADGQPASAASYRKVVRFLLQLLTSRVEHTLQKYGNLTETDKHDPAQREEVVALLNTLVQSLEDIQRLYRDFRGQDSDTRQILDRLERTINKYQQQRSRYQ